MTNGFYNAISGGSLILIAYVIEAGLPTSKARQKFYGMVLFIAASYGLGQFMRHLVVSL